MMHLYCELYHHLLSFIYVTSSPHCQKKGLKKFVTGVVPLKVPLCTFIGTQLIKCCTFSGHY